MNHTTSQTYDNVGNIHTKTDGRGNITTYNYDNFNRLSSVVNAKNETTGYTYDPNGNMLTQTDGLNHTTIYEYNAANKPVKKIDHGGRTGTYPNYSYVSAKVESSAYDGNGNLLTKVDRNGDTTTYTYDVHDRMLTMTAGTVSVSYAYDNNGNRLNLTDSTGATTQTYDELNRIKAKTVPGITGSLTYLYDITAGLPSGQVSETDTDQKGNATTRVFDKAGRMISVTASGSTTTYTYYDNGSKHTVVYPGGNSEVYTYHEDGLLYTIVNYKADQTEIDYNWDLYDDAHNLTIKCDNHGTTQYTYDPVAGRFISEDAFTGNPDDPLSLNLYTYCHNEPLMYSDPSGNVTVFGNSGDVNNFKTYMGKEDASDYDYEKGTASHKINPYSIAKSDLIVGGPAARYGVASNPHGARRIYGKNSQGTIDAIKAYKKEVDKKKASNASKHIWYNYESNGWKITNCWNDYSPSGKYWGHLADDLDPKGTDGKIRALTDGVVYDKGSNPGGNGNIIIVKHEIYVNNQKKYFYSTYSHLSKFTVGKGKEVKSGEQLGVVGNTGRTNGYTHLHLMVVVGTPRLDILGYNYVYVKGAKQTKQFNDHGKGYFDYGNLRYYDPHRVVSTKGQIIQGNYPK